MNNFFENKRIYPKSVNNRSCITPCYPPDKWIVHPITLQQITSPDKKKPFCAITEINENGKVTTSDICHVKSINSDDKLLYLYSITPIIDFNCETFIKIYYQIYSFEDGMTYLSNNENIPFLTKERILNCCINVFDVSKVNINNNIINMFINFLKNNWIEYLFFNLEKYIYINKNKIKLKLQKKFVKGKDKNIKINYIIEKFLIKKNIFNILTEYFNNPKKNKTINEIKQLTLKYIETKINNTI